MSVVDGVDGFSGAGVLRLSGVDVDSETVGCFSGVSAGVLGVGGVSIVITFGSSEVV